MKHILSVIILFFLFSFLSYAQTYNEDTTFIRIDLDFRGLSENIDSMLVVWCAQEIINPTGNIECRTNDSSIFPFFSEEEYVDLLSRMSSCFEMPYNDM